jgi:glycine/D-amino acid oxidase-like deaminating enzyme
VIDFLIVGGGISGINIAAKLQQYGKSFHLIDPCDFKNATAISAGIINPVTGRKFATQWNMDELIPLASKTYGGMEKMLHINCLQKTAVLKIHKSESGLEDWLQIKSTNQVSHFISEFTATAHLAKFIDYRFGGITITPAYFLDTKMLLNAFYKSINSHLIKSSFMHSDLIEVNGQFIYNNIIYQHIIFCEGIHAMHNPYFDFIAFKPAKGECLIVEIPNFSTKEIIMKGIMLVPINKETYWVGATNTWNDLEPVGTASGKAELEAGLRDLLKVPYTILEHKSAIRPTIRDRAPAVGKHPTISNMFVMNGMGTKGTAYAPYYAAQLLAHIFNNTPINKEANVNRF